MTRLATIVKYVDYLRDRYAAFPVRDEKTRAGVQQVLDEVRRKELKRVTGRSTLESAAFADTPHRGTRTSRSGPGDFTASATESQRWNATGRAILGKSTPRRPVAWVCQDVPELLK